jgi:hypothetical protein
MAEAMAATSSAFKVWRRVVVIFGSLTARHGVRLIHSQSTANENIALSVEYRRLTVRGAAFTDHFATMA